jgi:carbamoyl-phosphate synthase small subunit
VSNKALLALEDGTVFEGTSFGARGERTGEVVFNTAMTGYQEVMTDPSYQGQIVVMTYPHIGNYGVNLADFESSRPYVEGFVAREFSEYASNWRATARLSEFMRAFGVVGVSGIDTRALTTHIRTVGAQIGVITTETLLPAAALDLAKRAPRLVGRDLVAVVAPKEARPWHGANYHIGERKGHGQCGEPLPLPTEGERRDLELMPPPLPTPPRRFRVVALDCGIKHNILRRFETYGCAVAVTPPSMPAEQILESKPDGVFVSNGPGDPQAVTYAITTVRNLLGKIPIFGICLGHQIVGLAVGGSTYKLKFGHRGANHPVLNHDTDRVEITTQNHGFAVDMESVAPFGMEMTHENLNDHTNEGMRHKEWPLFSVQYHPEASPGPHDSDYLFVRFLEMMSQWGGKRA